MEMHLRPSTEIVELAHAALPETAGKAAARAALEWRAPLAAALRIPRDNILSIGGWWCRKEKRRKGVGRVNDVFSAILARAEGSLLAISCPGLEVYPKV